MIKSAHQHDREPTDQTTPPPHTTIMPPVNSRTHNYAPTTHRTLPYPIPPRDRNTTLVRVLPRPRRSRGGNITWTTDVQPESRLKKDIAVTLIAENAEVAHGRLSIITDLRRHWVTFKLTGAPTDRVYVRTPVTWSQLDGLERYTHMTRYTELNPNPEPHPSYRDLPNFRNDRDTNPYIMIDRECRDEQMEKRISEILNIE